MSNPALTLACENPEPHGKHPWSYGLPAEWRPYYHCPGVASPERGAPGLLSSRPGNAAPGAHPLTTTIPASIFDEQPLARINDEVSHQMKNAGEWTGE